MKTFAATLIATAVTARGGSGGINQGFQNASFSASHGYGYNEGNGYLAGDSHGQTLDFRAHGAATKDAYDVSNYFETNTHIFGYDSVGTEGSDYDTAAAVALAVLIDA